MITFIWAEDKNRLIGNKGKLPWYLPNDLQFFKQKTLNKKIVMGRTTFEGMGKRLLPNRKTYVLTNQKNYDANGATLTNVEEVLQLSKQGEEIFILGGTKVFQTFLPFVEKIHQTIIDYEFDGDMYMAPISFDEFECISIVAGQIDDKNKYKHQFLTYIKRK